MNKQNTDPFLWNIERIREHIEGLLKIAKQIRPIHGLHRHISTAADDVNALEGLYERGKKGDVSCNSKGDSGE